MELYHFTANRFVDSILKYGITKGVMVKTFSPPEFIFNKQWLTVNSDFKQDWAIGTGRLPYKRNEVRFMVEIPTGQLENLKPWTQMQFLTPETAKQLSAYGDPENWYIFQGKIPPWWIKEFKRHDFMADCASPKCTNKATEHGTFCDAHGGVIAGC